MSIYLSLNMYGQADDIKAASTKLLSYCAMIFNSKSISQGVMLGITWCFFPKEMYPEKVIDQSQN